MSDTMKPRKLTNARLDAFARGLDIAEAQDRKAVNTVLLSKGRKPSMPALRAGAGAVALKSRACLALVALDGSGSAPNSTSVQRRREDASMSKAIEDLTRLLADRRVVVLTSARGFAERTAVNSPIMIALAKSADALEAERKP
jgi:hypothetical protein